MHTVELKEVRDVNSVESPLATDPQLPAPGSLAAPAVEWNQKSEGRLAERKEERAAPQLQKTPRIPDPNP